MVERGVSERAVKYWLAGELKPRALPLARLMMLVGESEVDFESATSSIFIEDDKDKLHGKSKQSTSKKSSKETKLDCDYCPLFKLYGLAKFVDGEGTGNTFKIMFISIGGVLAVANYFHEFWQKKK